MVILSLGILGVCLGSFINALVWRLHEQAEIRGGISKKLSKKQQAKLERLSLSRGRSMCPHCENTLAWYDLIPLVSWLALKGRCRYCKAVISVQYPLVELVTACLFVLSYILWPFDLGTNSGVILLGLWLVMLVFLVALLVYDAKWFLLPNRLTYPLIIIALAYGVVRTLGIEGLDDSVAAGELLLGALSVGGLYWLLYEVSDGKWVGGGDSKLGLAMGFILGWQAGLLAVFLANIFGLVWILPKLLAKKISSQAHIPFGPFLILALVVAVLWGQPIIDWYIQQLLVI